jgi:hypothetical protein
MTILNEKTQVPVMREPLAHVVEWVMGLVGTVAAGIGLLIYHGPDPLEFFGWEWTTADLDAAWPLSLIIVGGLMLASAFAIFSSREYAHHGEGDLRVITGSVLALLALAGAITYFVIWLV